MAGLLLSPIIQRAPDGWREAPANVPVPGARAWARHDGLHVVAGLEMHDDEQWAHVSCSYTDHLPSWDDLKAVKEIWLGDVLAFQVLPPKAEYVSQHPWCLHLWHRLAGDPFPRMARTR